MADTSMTPNNNSLLYVIIGGLAVLVAGGGLYLYKMDRIEPLPPVPVPVPVEAAKPAPIPAPPVAAPPAASPRPTPPPAAPAGPSAAQLSQARSYIADARRFATAGNFTSAESALQSADTTIPGFAETAVARREIAEMRTARGQLAPLINQARRSMERGDFVTADRALDEAERLYPNAPEVVDARRDLRAARRQGAQPGTQDMRVTVLLTAARAAMTIGDFGSADRALDEAERIDPRDPAVRQARAELVAAQRPRPPR